jgi:hypothetical protein
MTLDDFLRDPAGACERVLVSGNPLTITRGGSELAPEATVLVLATAQRHHLEQLDQGHTPCHGSGSCPLLGCPRRSGFGSR